jgi:cytochrome c oxidase cbb3-type subunit IV
MTYEDWSHFAQNWGTVYFTVIFSVALGYALWPRNRRAFRDAAQLPLNEKDHGDDRPLA